MAEEYRKDVLVLQARLVKQGLGIETRAGPQELPILERACNGRVVDIYLCVGVRWDQSDEFAAVGDCELAAEASGCWRAEAADRDGISGPYTCGC